MLRHRIAQQITHHSKFIAPRLVRVLLQIAVYLPERLRPVVVVRVDNCEGAVHLLPGSQHRVAGPPGLHPPLRDPVPGGQVLQLLIGVLYFNDPGEPVADGGPELLRKLPLDDEYHRLKAGAPGVVDGVIYDELAVGPHGINLLQTAVSAPHSGRHDHKHRFFHTSTPSYLPYPSGFMDCHFQEEAHISSMP